VLRLHQLHAGGVEFEAVAEELMDELALGIDGARLLDDHQRHQSRHQAKREGQRAPKEPAARGGVGKAGKSDRTYGKRHLR
jgi:hypothetical protein